MTRSHLANVIFNARKWDPQISYTQLERKIRVNDDCHILEPLGTRVTFKLPTKYTAENFTRFLASMGLVFQVDFHYDLKRVVSIVIA